MNESRLMYCAFIFGTIKLTQWENIHGIHLYIYALFKMSLHDLLLKMSAQKSIMTLGVKNLKLSGIKTLDMYRRL